MQTTLTGAPVSHDSDVVYAGGDYVFADRYATPQRGDIVVINAYNKKTHETKVIIKRIIALEGDYIQIIDGVVWLNDKLLEESYINPQNNTNCESYPLTYIPEGGMFVMGDNRDDSNDSRKDYGVLQTSDILGVVTQWSIDSKSFITSINTFFDFTVKGWFS
jgi:signal peptidase I